MGEEGDNEQQRGEKNLVLLQKLLFAFRGVFGSISRTRLLVNFGLFLVFLISFYARISSLPDRLVPHDFWLGALLITASYLLIFRVFLPIGASFLYKFPVVPEMKTNLESNFLFKFFVIEELRK